MSGYHGTVGATGVRPAVCPEPLRRALTLVGLLTGILFTVWLASAAPAHSAELSGPGNALSGGLVESTQNLGGSISGAVTTVGEHAAKAVDGASEAAQAVETEAADPVQHVRDAVRETSLPSPEQLPEFVAPVPEQVTAPAPEADGDAAYDEAREDGESRARTSEEVVAVAEEPAAQALSSVREQSASADQGSVSAERGTAGDTGLRGADTVNTVASGTAPAIGGSAPAPAVAGFLPVTGAPAPAPGLFEAARHVLRSVPAESADEPTFSPD
ncbi:hypothetical protein NE857_01590 [Nocardiopsis exhalans]|uniref:Meckel syndrome type 1 protein n=1 Tax=Nocardiopsis exhalans TaxID=163604 RepID=A0ABY5DB84_9ACTN|nr:hypothetical protein [Nocardiopsis exhalans]USY20382.1 hypothetical protein NE857_01590 [Nocardiopsis exhalans]